MRDNGSSCSEGFSDLFLNIHFWWWQAFTAVCGLSLAAVSGGYSALRCTGFSLRWRLLLQSTGSGAWASAVVAKGFSCSAACGVFPDQGSNPCPLHWQADSYPLHHRGSPLRGILWRRTGREKRRRRGKRRRKERMERKNTNNMRLYPGSQETDSVIDYWCLSQSQYRNSWGHLAMNFLPSIDVLIYLLVI